MISVTGTFSPNFGLPRSRLPSMLEPISLGQGRTHCPGLAADERGVVMGRRLALFFADIARAVGFFRSYSREVNLDEILASLEIREAVSERGGREIMIRFEVGGSYPADRAAQAARMHRGRAFTGTERHYILYRDRKSPLGYDLGGPEEVVQDPGDLVLYGEAGPDRRKLAREINIRDLVLGLSPRPLTENERSEERYEAIVVRTEMGLAKEVARYLWHRQVRATVVQAVSAKKSLFSGKPREVQLVRCENIPHHMAKLLAKTPGMDVFIPVQPHLLVEWGFRHPIALESVGAAFEENETILFFGPPGKVERLHADDDAVDIRDLVDVSMHGPGGVIAAPEQAEASPIEALGVELRLARLPGASGSTQALLIDIDRISWFMKLVYMLPAAVLRAYEAAIADPYIIVINRRGVHGIPFGEPMTELYPQIFTPVGMQLLPRVDYDLLREHLQIRPDQNFYFFPEDKPAFAIAHDQFKPLARAVVADERARQSMVELRSRDAIEELGKSTVSHRAQGVFSLWRGTRVEAIDEAKRLPPPTQPPKALPPKKSQPQQAAQPQQPPQRSQPPQQTQQPDAPQPPPDKPAG
jgi:hypothetical protein